MRFRVEVDGFVGGSGQFKERMTTSRPETHPAVQAGLRAWGLSETQAGIRRPTPTDGIHGRDVRVERGATMEEKEARDLEWGCLEGSED